MYSKTLFTSQREADETIESLSRIINGAFNESLDNFPDSLCQLDKEILAKIEEMQELDPEDTEPSTVLLKSMIIAFYEGFGQGIRFHDDLGAMLNKDQEEGANND